MKKYMVKIVGDMFLVEQNDGLLQEVAMFSKCLNFSFLSRTCSSATKMSILP
jgi:hypothetical protein